MITGNKSIISYKLLILGILVATGLILHNLNFFDQPFFTEIRENYLGKWWLPPLLVFLTAMLFAFALPGSMIYLAAGLLYDSLNATLVIVAGGVSGAVAAYYFSQYMSKDSRNRIQSSKLFSIMQKQCDFATLSAIRTLPGFPHSIINYGSGIINVSMPKFIAAAIIGFSAKGFLYASAIQQATTVDPFRETGRVETVLPLVGLALFFITGKIIHKKFFK
jgi:uncharacterized membrane protein YdjX (TVP38/TMEM64 family)